MVVLRLLAVLFRLIYFIFKKTMKPFSLICYNLVFLRFWINHQTIEVFKCFSCFPFWYVLIFHLLTEQKKCKGEHVLEHDIIGLEVPEKKTKFELRSKSFSLYDAHINGSPFSSASLPECQCVDMIAVRFMLMPKSLAYLLTTLDLFFVENMISNIRYFTIENDHVTCSTKATEKQKKF